MFYQSSRRLSARSCPDLDAVESRIKNLEFARIRPFAPLSVLVNRNLGHRGLMHSPIALFPVSLFALLIGLWWGWLPSFALVLGYASHLLTDACTVSGIPWLTARSARLHLLPKSWRIVAGSNQEELIFVLLALAAVTFFLLHLPITGFTFTGLS